jgi:hypothetical protein
VNSDQAGKRKSPTSERKPWRLLLLSETETPESKSIKKLDQEMNPGTNTLRVEAASKTQIKVVKIEQCPPHAANGIFCSGETVRSRNEQRMVAKPNPTGEPAKP